MGEAFGRELADKARLRPRKSLAAGVSAMCDAVGALGYQATVEEISGDRAVIATPTCPLRPLVRARADAADVARGMWAALAARAVSGADVERVDCETHDCLADHASCRVELRLRRL